MDNHLNILSKVSSFVFLSRTDRQLQCLSVTQNDYILFEKCLKCILRILNSDVRNDKA